VLAAWVRPASAISADGTPAVPAAVTARTITTTYTALGHSSLSARSRTHWVQASPCAWCAIQDPALTYPPTRKKTGITWNSQVTHRPQLT
jgi:hypothetical protein